MEWFAKDGSPVGVVETESATGIENSDSGITCSGFANQVSADVFLPDCRSGGGAHADEEVAAVDIDAVVEKGEVAAWFEQVKLLFPFGAHCRSIKADHFAALGGVDDLVAEALDVVVNERGFVIGFADGGSALEGNDCECLFIGNKSDVIFENNEV